jgi:3-isopropylmalate/(R)-2-methylmalate dehydratase large subunit
LSSEPTTLFEKVWRNHEVVPETPDTPAVLYIDLHLTHEVTTPQAFTVLRERGWQVRRPDLTLATMDHSTPTRTEQVFGGAPITIESAAQQIRQLEKNCAEFGIELLGLQHELRGIVHVIGPELGLTQPGKTIVCGDSHTSTHGAFGALAFGIGSTEVAQAAHAVGRSERRAARRRDCERPDPRHHRQARRVGRHGSRHRVSWRHIPRARHG